MPQSTPFWDGEHPSDTNLRQFVSGNLASEAERQVGEHLASCAHCQAHLEQVVQEGEGTKTSLVALTQAFAIHGFASPLPKLGPIEPREPDFETLAAYVEGTLTRQEAEAVEASMRQFPRLAQKVADLRRLDASLERSPSSEFAQIPEQSSRETALATGVKPRSSSSAPTWWTRWRWPIQSLGLASALALLLLLAVKPWQHKLPPSPVLSPGGEKNTHGLPTVEPVSPAETPLPDGGTNDTDRNGKYVSPALVRSVKIQPYKIKGSFNKENEWNVSPSSGARQPMAFSQHLEFKVGDGVQFRFDNQSKQTLYLAALWRDRDGNDTQLTPLGSNTSPVVRLAPQGTKGAQVFTNVYAIRPPIGAETIKIVISTRALDPHSLEFDSLEGSTPQERKTRAAITLPISTRKK